jgi:hypothetical protein
MIERWRELSRFAAQEPIVDQALRLLKTYAHPDPDIEYWVQQSIQEQRRKIPGWVYLVGTEGGFYKIGRTTKVAERLAALNTGTPGGVTLIYAIYTVDSVDLERLFHDAFEEERVRGEWFALPDRDVEWFGRMADLLTPNMDGEDEEDEA